MTLIRLGQKGGDGTISKPQLRNFTREIQEPLPHAQVVATMVPLCMMFYRKSLLRQVTTRLTPSRIRTTERKSTGAAPLTLLMNFLLAPYAHTCPWRKASRTSNLTCTQKSFAQSARIRQSLVSELSIMAVSEGSLTLRRTVKSFFAAGTMSTLRLLFNSGISPIAQIIIAKAANVTHPDESTWIISPMGVQVQDYATFFEIFNVTGGT